MKAELTIDRPEKTTSPAFSQVVANSDQAMSIKYNNLVYDLKRTGVDVKVLSLGEAFFDIPLFPVNDLPYPQLYHYTHSRGIFELREKLCEYYLRNHAEFDFDEVEIVNNRPMNIWLYAKCRKYIDPADPGDDLDNAEVEVKGEYDDNPTGGL